MPHSADEIDDEIKAIWWSGEPVQPLREKLGLGIGMIGTRVLQLGLPLRDHGRRTCCLPTRGQRNAGAFAWD